MDFVNSIANLISQGARALFAAGSIISLAGIGLWAIGASHDTWAITLVIGVSVIGGGLALLAWDSTAEFVHRRRLRNTLREGLAEMKQAAEKLAGTSDKDELEFQLEACMNIAKYRREMIQSYRCNADVKTRATMEIENLAKKIWQTVKKPAPRGPSSWMAK